MYGMHKILNRTSSFSFSRQSSSKGTHLKLKRIPSERETQFQDSSKSAPNTKVSCRRTISVSTKKTLDPFWLDNSDQFWRTTNAKRKNIEQRSSNLQHTLSQLKFELDQMKLERAEMLDSFQEMIHTINVSSDFIRDCSSSSYCNNSNKLYHTI